MRRVAVALSVLVVATGCGASADQTVTVLAAASLRQAFGEMGEPARTELSFASSSLLATQIDHGAPADVFASADEANMRRVEALTGPPLVFALNELQIVVEPGNPHGIGSLADLVRPGLRVALAGPTVPAGRYAREAFDRAGLTEPPSSHEPDPRSVVAKVALGEADVGVVYVTDVQAAGDAVEGVPIPAEHNVAAAYVIAVLRDASHPAGARAFVDLVTSRRGRDVLSRHGFGLP